MLCVVGCACRQLLDSLGEGAWARLCMCCYFELIADNKGGPTGLCWARKRGPRGGPLGHGAVLVMVAREPVAINEVVTWRYRFVVHYTQLRNQTTWQVTHSTPSLHQRHDKPKAKNWSERLGARRNVSHSNTPFQLRNQKTPPPRKGRKQTATEHSPSSASNATQRNSASAARNSIELLLVIRWILVTRLASSTIKCCVQAGVVKSIRQKHLQMGREQVYNTSLGYPSPMPCS